MELISKAAIAALVTAAALIAPEARGADPTTDEAQRLFLEGRDALNRGDRATACGRFAQSLALVRAAGTLFNLAACDEQDGKLLAAQARWDEGLRLLAENDPRARLAREKLADLDRRTPRLVITPAPGAPAGLEIAADGRVLAPSAIGQPTALDPGDHVIVIRARGRRDGRIALRLAEGERRTLQVAPGPEEEAPAAPPKPPSEAPRPAGGSGRKTAALVLGGVGVVGFVVAGVTGGLLLARDGRIDDHCPNQRCDAEGRRLIDGATPLFVTNAVGFGVGIAGVAAGTILVLTGPRASDPRSALAPVTLPGGAGLQWTGRF